MQQYPTNSKYSSRHHDDLAVFIKEELAKALPNSLMMKSKRRVAERLADRLAADNPQFDREKFLKACGLEDD